MRNDKRHDRGRHPVVRREAVKWRRVPHTYEVWSKPVMASRCRRLAAQC